MRTKALLAGAMIGAASLATSMAQVYSVNIVGYVNMTFPAKSYSIVQNPLNNPAGNTVANIMPTFTGATNYMRIYKWNPLAATPGYVINSWSVPDPANDNPGGWSNPNMVLNPGEGFFIYNPNGVTVTATFVGEVATGDLVVPVYRGFNMVGSPVPQQGNISDLGYIPTDASYEKVYVWDPVTSKYILYSFAWPNPEQDIPGGWSPSVPTLNVGQAAFLYRPTGTSNAWTRTFNVQ